MLHTHWARTSQIKQAAKHSQGPLMGVILKMRLQMLYITLTEKIIRWELAV